MATIQGELWGVKLLLALWRSVPIQDFPVESELKQAFEAQRSVMENSASEYLKSTFVSPGWKQRIQEFVKNDALEAFDRDTIEVWLSLYSGKRELEIFSFDNPTDFYQETLPIFQTLVSGLLIHSLSGQSTSPQDAFERIAACLSYWSQEVPKGFGLPGLLQIVQGICDGTILLHDRALEDLDPKVAESLGEFLG